MATFTEFEPNNTFAQRNLVTGDGRTIIGDLVNPADVDFLSFTGLNAATTFVAETVFFTQPGFVLLDSLLARHDATGAVIALDDDSGTFNLSRLTGTIGAGGRLDLSLFTHEINETFGAWRLEVSFNLAGTAAADVLTGSGYGESFAALAGNDTVVALGGDDSVDGGDGFDSIDGGFGNDRLRGDGAADTLIGGAGNDTLDGGLADDSMAGGTGNDRYLILDFGDVVVEAVGGGIDTMETATVNLALAANVENLTLLGGLAIGGIGNVLANRMVGNASVNALSGEGGNDTLTAGAGDDFLAGGDGDDRLEGGTGDDLLDGNPGNDLLLGGDGDDTLVAGFSTGTDTLNGGAGNDVYELADPGDVIIDTAGEADLIRANVGGVTLGAGLEHLIMLASGTGTGNAVGNFMQSSDFGNTLFGLGGADTMRGGSADDRLVGGDGNDFLEGAAGVDTLEGGGGSDRIDGGEGGDVVRAGDAFDIVDAGAGNDTIDGGAGSDALSGGAGEDSVVGGSDDGSDSMNGGDGNDSLDGGGGGDFVGGGAGNDSLRGGAGAGVDTIEGGDGNDSLDGGDGGDFVFGGTGADVLIGGLGADRLSGNGGGLDFAADRFVFRSVAESNAAGGIDSIGEFDGAGVAGGDIIDLEAIDVQPGGADDDFSFIGTSAFTAAGQLRAVGSPGGLVSIQGNLDADLATIEFEFSVLLAPGQQLSAADFDL